MEDYSIIYDSFEVSIKTDIETIQGILCYFNSYYKLSKQRVSVVGEKDIYIDKSYILSQDVTNIPNSIDCSFKYAVVLRTNRSYDIYGFDNINFLNGIYIAIGFCREEYSYVIRKVIECSFVESDGLSSKVLKNNNSEIIEKVASENKIVCHNNICEIIPPTETIEEKVENEDINEIVIEDIKKVDYPVIPRSPVNSPPQERRKPIRASPKRASLKKTPEPVIVESVKINFDSMKLEDLKKYAKDNNVDIRGLTRKGEIVEKLKN